MVTFAAGIDPGASGAIAFVGSDGSAWAEHFDTKDAASMRDWLKSQPKPLIAVVERVSTGGANNNAATGHRMSPRSAFTFGGSYYTPKAVLTCLRIPQTEVTPGKWQKQIVGIGGVKGKERKDAIRKAAQARWPDVELSRKKDSATADALWIARWALVQEGVLK